MRHITTTIVAAMLVTAAGTFAADTVVPPEGATLAITPDLVAEVSPLVGDKLDPVGPPELIGTEIQEVAVEPEPLVSEQMDDMGKMLDWTGDGAIDIFDMLAYIHDWCGCVEKADIDKDGRVHGFDLLVYLDEWMHSEHRK